MKFLYPRRTRPFKSGVCTCTDNPDPVPREKHRWAIQRSDPRLRKVALAFLMVAWRKRALGRDVQENQNENLGEVVHFLPEEVTLGFLWHGIVSLAPAVN